MEECLGPQLILKRNLKRRHILSSSRAKPSKLSGTVRFGGVIWFMSLLDSGRVFSLKSKVDFPPPHPGQGLLFTITDLQRCQEEVSRNWNRAFLIRATKKSRVNSMDQLREIYFPERERSRDDMTSDLPVNHRKGLLGEILTELIAQDCGPGVNLLHVNWHLTGTSTGKGIDLLGLDERGSSAEIILFESKFSGHSSSEEPTSKARSVINAAFLQIADYSELEHRLAPAIHSIARRNITSPVRGYDLLEIKRLLRSKRVVSVVSLTLGTEGVLHAHVLTACPNHVQNIPAFVFSILDIYEHRVLTDLIGTVGS